MFLLLLLRLLRYLLLFLLLRLLLLLVFLRLLLLLFFNFLRLRTFVCEEIDDEVVAVQWNGNE